MPDVTRRGFLRATSVSAAALGLIGTLPAIAFADSSGSGAPPAAMPPMGGGPAAVPMSDGAPVPASVPMLGDTPFMVYVTDAASGAGVLLIGEQTIPFTSPDIVQAVQQALG